MEIDTTIEISRIGNGFVVQSDLLEEGFEEGALIEDGEEHDSLRRLLYLINELVGIVPNDDMHINIGDSGEEETEEDEEKESTEEEKDKEKEGI